MACRMLRAIMLQSPLSEASHLIHKNGGPILNWSNKPSFSGPSSERGTASASPGKSFKWRRRHGWKIAFALDAGGGIADNGGSEERVNENGETGGGGSGERTPRLGRLVSAGGRELLMKLNSARKNFPMKVFLLLLGFYTANALATILGQTGDWDVLVAGVVVAAIEGIGILMYKRKPKLPPPSSPPTTTTTGGGRFQSLVVMINYWKAGLCLGLFVDAFKLGS